MIPSGESKEELRNRIKRLEGEVSALKAKLGDSERQTRLQQSIIDNIEDVAYLVSEPGEIEFLSKAFERVTGWTTDQWTGKNFAGLVHPDDAALALEWHRLALESPDVATHRFRVRTAGGDYVTGEFRDSLIRKDDGTTSVLGVARDVTDQVALEEEYRIERELLRALVDRSPLGISMRDRKGRLLSANEAWARIWAMPEGAVQEDMNRDREDLKFDSRDDYLGDWLPKVQQVYRRGGSLLIPELMIDHHRSGQKRWVSQHFYAILDAYDKVDRVVILTEDITERKAAREALVESEQKYRGLIESAQDAIFTFDKNGVLLFLNQVGAARLGGAPLDFIGKSQWELFPKHVADRQMAMIRQVCNTGRGAAAESLTEIGDKKVRHYTMLQPMPGPDGKVESVLGVARDITELIETREALRDKEQEHSRLLQDLPVGVFRSTVDGVVESVNPALARMYGFDSEQEIMARSANDGFCDPRQRDRILKRLEREGNVRDYECKMRRKDGSIMWISMSVHAVLDADGKMTHMDGIEIDITDRKRAQEALRQSGQTLRALLDATTNVLFLMDTDGIILAANEATCLAKGVSEDELVGTSAHGYLPEELTRLRRAREQEVVASGKPARFEDEFAGQIREHSLFPVFDDDGAVRAITVYSEDVTDRKKAETALRESEEKYRNLFENAQAGMFRSALDGSQILAVNQRMADIWGYSIDECLSLPVSSFWPKPENRDEFVRALQAEGVVRDFEISTRREDGTTQHALLSATLSREKGYIEGTVVDITDRKRAEQALQESEQVFRVLAETAPAGILILQGEKFAYTNIWLQQFLGFEPDDGEKLHIFDFIHPDHREMVRERAMARQRGERVPESYETKVVTQSGETRWVLLKARMITYRGNPATLGIVVDVTDQRKAIEALRESEEKYRGLLESIPVGVFQSTPEGKILTANPCFLTMYGHDSVESMSRAEAVDAYWDPADRDKMLALLQRDGSFESHEIKMKRLDGTEFWVNASMRAVFDENGTLIRLDGVDSDITERKQFEEALRESQAQLSAIVEGTDDIILLSDHQGRPVYFNSAYKKVMKELIGLDMKPGLKPHTLLPDAGERAVWEDNHRRVLNGERFTFEHSFAGLDGHRRYFESSYYPVMEGETITGFSEFTHEITERRKADEALRESEEMLRSTIASIKDLVFLLDTEGVFTAYYYSGPAGDLYLPAAEFIGKSYSDVLPTGLTTRMRSALEALETTGTVQHFDYYLDFSGRRMWYTATASMRRGPAGEPVGTTLVARDITDRKRAEEELRASEAKFRQLLERLPVGVIQVSVDGKILSGNPALAEMYGFESEREMLGLSVNDYFRDETQAAIVAKSLARQGLVTDFEAEMKRADGSTFWVSLTVACVYDNRGELSHFDGVEVDITDRLAALEALKESEAKFRRITERSFDMIFIADPDGNLTFASPASEPTLGYSPAELLGRNVTEIIHESSLPDLARGFAEIKLGRAVGPVQLTAIASDGGSIGIEVNATPIVRNGRVVGSQSVVRDISERKRAEEMIERAHMEQSRQLRQVAGGLAHDIYNDLFPVSASLYKLRQRLEQSADNDRDRNLKLLSLMDSAVRRAIDLTESVNLYSKLDAVGIQDSNSLTETLEDVLIQNRERLNDLKVEVDMAVPREIRIRCPQPHVFYLFNNLLINALDSLSHSPEGRISITAVSQGNRIRIEFKDDGCGIDPKTLPRIFDPFFSTKPRTGSGLGLATVKRILDLCGGKIEAKSSLDKGTTFIILMLGDVGT